jgi:predicted phage terminase large subunit-like protein
MAQQKKHGALVQPAINAMLRQDFNSFVRKCYAHLNPGRPLKDNWHINAITAQLMDVSSGETRRLRINIPPRCLKSIIVAVSYVAFEIGHDPTKMVIVVSHNQKLAAFLSAEFRKIVSSPWYKDAFPTMKGAPDKDTELIFRTSAGGGRIAISPEMGVTGLGADTIILDDPIDASNATNQALCMKTNDWVDQVLSTRLNDPAKSPIIVVMQRIGEYDTCAHIEQQTGWTSLILPAIFEQDAVVNIGHGQTRFVKKGDLLHPARLPPSFLEAQRITMMDAPFQAQYQQHPIPIGAGLIDTSLFSFCEKAPIHHLEYSFMSVDPAPGNPSGSYTVVQLFRVRNGLLFMTHCIRGHWTLPKLVDLIFGLRKQQNIQGIVLEHAGYGIAVCEAVFERLSYDDRALNYQVIKPRASKTDRVFQAMNDVKNRNVILQSNAQWLPAFLNELKAFPAGQNDDQVDAFSQAVHFYRRSRFKWSEPTKEARKSYIM